MYKPKPDHPWRKLILNREITAFINQSTTLAKVNDYKVGGGLPVWNGRK